MKRRGIRPYLPSPYNTNSTKWIVPRSALEYCIVNWKSLFVRGFCSNEKYMYEGFYMKIVQQQQQQRWTIFFSIWFQQKRFLYNCTYIHRYCGEEKHVTYKMYFIKLNRLCGKNWTAGYWDGVRLKIDNELYSWFFKIIYSELISDQELYVRGFQAICTFHWKPSNIQHMTPILKSILVPENDILYFLLDKIKFDIMRRTAQRHTKFYGIILY
jgi:hypothetical protein